MFFERPSVVQKPKRKHHPKQGSRTVAWPTRRQSTQSCYNPPSMHLNNPYDRTNQVFLRFSEVLHVKTPAKSNINNYS